MICANSHHFYDVIEITARKFIQNKIKFVYAGSISTLLQGCDLIPGDIDILVSSNEDVHQISSVFIEYLLEEAVPDDTAFDRWIASKNETNKEFIDPWNNTWTFSRFFINEMKIEIANIHTYQNQQILIEIKKTE